MCRLLFHSSYHVACAPVQPAHLVRREHGRDEGAHVAIACEGAPGQPQSDVTRELRVGARVQLREPVPLDGYTPPLPAHSSGAFSHVNVHAVESLCQPGRSTTCAWCQASARRPTTMRVLRHRPEAPYSRGLRRIRKCRTRQSFACHFEPAHNAPLTHRILWQCPTGPDAVRDEGQQRIDQRVAVRIRVDGRHILQVHVQVTGPPLPDHLLGRQNFNMRRRRRPSLLCEPR